LIRKAKADPPTSQALERARILFADACDELRENAKYLARAAVRSGCTASEDDLIQDALLAAMHACLRYDESSGATFATFATARMQGQIYDTWRKHNQFVGRGRAERQAVRIALDSDETRDAVYRLADSRYKDEQREADDRDEVAVISSGLKERTAAIVHEYFHKDRTIRDIASTCGLSDSRVWQILQQARAVMRNAAQLKTA
jgi:RNA polymerase sigma factor (sigma-70 family)